jgi:hypothetical protein
MTAAGTAANAVAGSKARKAAQSTMNANTAAQAAQFDRRNADIVTSDARKMDLTKGQYGDTSDLENKTFDYLLGQSKTHADSVDLAQRGLVTAQKTNQDRRVAAKGAEALRQSGYLDQITNTVVNAIHEAAPGSQMAFAADDFANRLKTMNTALGGPSVAADGTGAPAGADPLVAGAFASRAKAANDAGLEQGKALSRVGSYTDAADRADMTLKQGGTFADLIQGRAALSNQMGNAEQSNIDASDVLAQQHADFSKGLADWLQQQRGNAYTTYSNNKAGALGDYYGRSLQSENDYTTGMLGSSQHLEDTNTSLANYKIANTQADTTFGDLLKAGGSAIAGMDPSAMSTSFSKLANVIKPPIQKASNMGLNTLKAFGSPSVGFG